MLRWKGLAKMILIMDLKISTKNESNRDAYERVHFVKLNPVNLTVTLTNMS